MKHQFIVVTLMLIIVAASCSHQADQVEPMATGKAAPPSPMGVAATVAAPPAAKMTGVTPQSYSGAVDLATVKSTEPCKSPSDCTFTKFANAPRTKAECACQAACEPFVVNVATKSQRERTNSICSNSDWFGDQCPAPICNFLEYDRFDCVDGMCQGTDLNGK